MACKVADNEPLRLLRDDLGLPFQCHSLREHCAQGQSRKLGDLTMAAAGAAIGYCQALFNRTGDPDCHTAAVLESLLSLGAPWPKSHELFWGYRREEAPAVFVEKALTPLSGTGRVPVVITGLDPANDFDSIASILATKPAVFPGESVLLRLVLRSRESVENAVKLVRYLLDQAWLQKQMPVWWPLFQPDFSQVECSYLKSSFGEEWRYTNIAVNPFTPVVALSELKDRITVAQFVVGAEDGIHLDGHISVPEGMSILGAKENASYNVFEYAALLKRSPVIPTCILLGPSLSAWTLRQNEERLQRFLSVFRTATDTIWERLGESDREMVWRLVA